MTAIMVLGSLSAGVLVLNRLIDAIRPTIVEYYGVASLDQQMNDGTAAAVSLHFLEFALAVIAFVGTIGFVIAERRRIHSLRSLGPDHGEHVSETRVVRLERREWAQVALGRTLIFGGLLTLLMWAQLSYERVADGLGWVPIGVGSWRALLPYATIMSLTLIVGAIVAAASMFGLRVLHRLHRLATEDEVYAIEGVQPVAQRSSARVATLRERFGDNLLSRPPPVILFAV